MTQYQKIYDQLYNTRGVQEGSVIEAHNILFSWSFQQSLPLLEDISFKLNKKHIISILGHTGSGKSTLARLLVGNIRPQKGTILINGEVLKYGMSRTAIHQRAQIQIIPQIPSLSFNPFLSIYDGIKDAYVMFALRVSSLQNQTLTSLPLLQEFNNYVKLLCEYLQVEFDMLSSFPSHVSGGQLQRCALIRALLVFPQVLVLDEPVSHLDVSIRKATLDMIKILLSETDLAIILISHLEEVHNYISQQQLCQRFNLEQGKLINAHTTINF